MAHVRSMQRHGANFTRYTVTDSLCCPSRSSIFTGRYPHSTGVFTNKAPDGGFGVFHAKDEQDTFATSLQAAGYRTGFMGKYLNGYTPKGLVDGKHRYIPPGWNTWAVAGNGYPEFNYTLNVDGKLVHYGVRPQDYLTDVISRRGRAFITSAVKAKQPFMLELATFAPHGPFTPATRDAHKFPGLKAPRGGAFDKAQHVGQPAWLSSKPLTAAEIKLIDADYRLRAQAVQAVDKMIGDIQATLRKLGVAKNTYIVFSSDNGFHLGDHRLVQGKQTAFDHDIRVPLVVTGPGIRAGRRISRLAENIDLRPTFQSIAGAPTGANVEGRSLLGLLHGRSVRSWRVGSLVEHHGPNTAPSDPDRATKRQGNPPSYAALRSANSIWVEYDNGGREYYDIAKDPFERSNLASKLTTAKRASLHARLAALRACTGGASCRAAGG